MKKILIKWFPKYFNVTVIRRIPVEKNKECSLIVRHLTESDSMIEALGIGTKRSEELQKFVMDALRTHTRATSAIEDVSSNVVHANELYFVTYVLHEKINMMQDPLMHMLKQFNSPETE